MSHLPDTWDTFSEIKIECCGYIPWRKTAVRNISFVYKISPHLQQKIANIFHARLLCCDLYAEGHRSEVLHVGKISNFYFSTQWVAYSTERTRTTAIKNANPAASQSTAGWFNKRLKLWHDRLTNGITRDVHQLFICRRHEVSLWLASEELYTHLSTLSPHELTDFVLSDC